MVSVAQMVRVPDCGSDAGSSLVRHPKLSYSVIGNTLDSGSRNWEFDPL